jgi:polysaccharide export outer membrane protein
MATRGLALVLAFAALTGCEIRGGKIPYDPAGFGPPDRITQGTEAYDVALGPLDVLRVNIFRVPDLSGEYQVDANGRVDLPLVGAVSVRDENAEQFATKLEHLYGVKYLNDPDITVRVQSTNQLNVTIEGGVATPGIYALPGKTTLLGAIALARGFNTQDSNPKRVAVFRKRDGKTVAAAFDVISIRHGDMADPVVYPGDTIVVDASKIRSIYRDLLQALPTVAVFNSL